MRIVSYMLNRQPLASAILALVLVFIMTGVLQAIFGLIVDSKPIAEASARYLASFLILIALVKAGSDAAVGITVPMRNWGRRWWVITALMAVIALTNFLADQVDFGALVFKPDHAVDWALRTTSSGVWEEIWFRGVCFYILYRVWGSTRLGLYKAAVTQALLFGALHLTNLHQSDLTYVVYQTTFATLIGFGFAGLVAYSRSIWPVVILHSAINAAGSFDNYFSGPAYSYPELTLETMITVIAMFLLFGALPGAWCLKRAPLVEPS